MSGGVYIGENICCQDIEKYKFGVAGAAYAEGCGLVCGAQTFPLCVGQSCNQTTSPWSVQPGEP